MKRALFAASIVAVALLLAASISYAQPMGPGISGQAPGWGQGYGPPQGQGWFCPWCGAYRGPEWGPGYGMMGPGYGMGPGMHYGYRMHRGYGPGYYGRYQAPREPLDKAEAEKLVKSYLDSLRNPNLKLGDIRDKGDVFEAEILTKDNSLVDKLLVDKRTGWFQSVY